MKKIFALMAISGVAVVLLSFSRQTDKQSEGPKASVSAQTNTTPKEKQENDFLEESKTNRGAYEFTKPGNYRFIITEVNTPPFDFVNFCLEGTAAGLSFQNQRIVCPEVKNEWRCITGLMQNLSSNEYVVMNIKAGAQIKAWPSNPGIVLKSSGIRCTNNKWDCNIFGPQAEWTGDGYSFKVMVMRYR